MANGQVLVYVFSNYEQVVSDGKLYGIPEGLCFSVPVTCKNFEAQVVSDIELDEFSKQKIEQSIGELLREKSQAD